MSRWHVSRRDLLKAGAVSALGLSGLLAACGRPAARPSGGNVTLEYHSWSPQVLDREKEHLMKPFTAKFPNIAINGTAAPWDQYWQKLQTLSVAGTPPDLMEMSVAYAWPFAESKFIRELDSWVKRDLNISDFYWTLAETLMYKGKIYAMPYAWVCSVLYYNKNMFDKAGIPYPDETWTYDKLLEVAKSLTRGNEQYGFLSSSQHTLMDAMISANGGSVLNKNRDASTLEEDVAVDTIQWLVNMIWQHKVSPSPQEIQGQQSPFESGKVAMTIDGSYQIDRWREIKDFEWDIALVPTGRAKRVIYGGPDSISIHAKTKHPEEAWEYLKWHTFAGRNMDSYAGGKVPMLKSLAQSEAWLEAGKAPANKKVILDSAPYIEGASFDALGWMEWRIDAVNNGLAPAFMNQQSVKEAVKATVENVNRALAKQKGKA